MTPDEKIRAANQLWVAMNDHSAEVASSMHSLSRLVNAVLDDPKSDEFKAVGKEMHQAALYLAASVGIHQRVFHLIEEIQDAARAEQKELDS